MNSTHSDLIKNLENSGPEVDFAVPDRMAEDTKTGIAF